MAAEYAVEAEEADVDDEEEDVIAAAVTVDGERRVGVDLLVVRQFTEARPPTKDEPRRRRAPAEEVAAEGFTVALRVMVLIIAKTTHAREFS